MSGCWSFFLRIGAIIGSLILAIWLAFSILSWIHSSNTHFIPFDWRPGDTPGTWVGHLGLGFLVSGLLLIACTVACGFFIRFALGVLLRPVGAITQAARTLRKNPILIIALTLGGSILAGIGFLVPWVTVTFAPPGGSLILGGIKRDAFSTTLSGSNMPYSPIPIVDAIRTHHILWITILTVFFLSLSLLVDLFPRSRIKQGGSQFLAWLAASLGAPIPRGVINLIQTLGHILASLAWLGLLSFVLIFGNPVAQTSSGNDVSIPYVTVTMGAGLGLMMVGFVLSGIGIYNDITTRLEELVNEGIKAAAQKLGQNLGIDERASEQLQMRAVKLGQNLGITSKIARLLEEWSLFIIRVSLVILLVLGSLAFAYIVLLPLVLQQLGFRFG